MVPTKLDDDKNNTTDQVVTDINAMALLIEQYSTRVLAIISTTSCFAPRVPDSIDEIGKLCARYTINHVINNAYGLQCEHTCKLLNRACVVGRVDAIICSTDKNFLVPVGTYTTSILILIVYCMCNYWYCFVHFYNLYVHLISLLFLFLSHTHTTHTYINHHTTNFNTI